MCLSPSVWIFPFKGKGWLTGDSQRQKNSSLRLKQVNQLAEVKRDCEKCKDLRPLDGQTTALVDGVEVLDRGSCSRSLQTF